MTTIEQGYVDQGYQLPFGWTWEQVAEQRAKYSVSEICVPVSIVPGKVVAWAVPMKDGRFLDHL